ncbi:uncharacterized protein LOC131678361 [Topomyia yanbarensis]|uniref:uncharacterized protein LOC131678361 n=1 Tax=Topomyia yanbarensis TaxID=2498891 RepID=UPI00273CB767|nr:uncharacterized protein LOC131678361 [Topomyia yanbarensis]
MACTNCSKVINDSERITCRGYCGNSFHMICVKLDYDVRDVLGIHSRNIFWMCNGCADLFCNDNFRRMASRCCDNAMPDDNSLKSLKDDIADLKDVVKALSVKVDTKPLSPTVNTPWTGIAAYNPVPNTPKRKREDDPLKAKITNIRGAKAAFETIKTVSPPEEVLWVYLSAFDPSTTDDEVSRLVKDCLGKDMQPKIVRLVPKDKDLSSLSFITFKVGVSKSCRDKALSKDSWPENIYFREFVTNSKIQRPIIRIAAKKNPSGGGQ